MRVDGIPVAVADLELGEWDNRDLGWLGIVVDPAHQATRLRLGRCWLSRWPWPASLVAPSSGPMAGRVRARSRLLAATGSGVASEELYSLAAPKELPRESLAAIRGEAAAHAGDYELVRIAGHAPDELIPAIAELTAAINDAPLDDLDVEDEVFPVERIRDYETATIEAGHRLYRIIARHRSTGEPAGHTVVVVDTETPTARLPARHGRGTRAPWAPAGAAAQGRDAALARRAEPQLTTIDTWNAESNEHMIAVNERLGYRALRSRAGLPVAGLTGR